MNKRILTVLIIVVATLMVASFIPIKAYNEFTVVFSPQANSLQSASKENPINITMLYTLQFVNVGGLIEIIRIDVPAGYKINATRTPRLWLYDEATDVWSNVTDVWGITSIPLAPEGPVERYILDSPDAGPALLNNPGDKLRISFYVVEPVAEGEYDWTVWSRDSLGDSVSGEVVHKVDNTPPSIIGVLPVNGTVHKADLKVRVEASNDTQAVFFGVAQERASLDLIPGITVPNLKYYHQLSYNSTSKLYEGAVSIAEIDALTPSVGYEDSYAFRVYASDGTFDPANPADSNWATRYHNNTVDTVAHGVDWSTINGVDIETGTLVFTVNTFNVTWNWFPPPGYVEAKDPFFQHFRIVIKGPKGVVVNTTTTETFHFFSVADVGTYSMNISYRDILNIWNEENAPIDSAFSYDTTRWVELYLNGVATHPADEDSWLYEPQGTSVHVDAITVGLNYTSTMNVNLTVTYHSPDETVVDKFIDRVPMVLLDNLTNWLRWEYIVPEESNARVGHYDVLAEWVDPQGGGVIASKIGKYAMYTKIPTAPVADAGTYYTGDEGSLIVLNASKSYDPDGTIVSYEWDWSCDGVYDVELTSPTTTYIWNDNTFVAICLRVTDDDGLTDTDDALVTVNNVPPTADAGPDQMADEGESISFTGSFVDPGILDTHAIQWDFGDGSQATGTLTPSHVYVEDGVYGVTLAVTDDDGGIGYDIITVTVNNVVPTVDAGPDQTVEEGSTVSFESTFTDPGTTDTHTIQWDFGDGTQTTGTLTTTHTYQDDGTYTITLTITDDDGGTGTDTLTVTVEDLSPISIFTWLPDPQSEGSPISFTDLSESYPDEITSWNWSFGDGETSTEKSPTHIFQDDGVYMVTLTVTDDDGSEAAMSDEVTVVNVAPTADAGPDQMADEGESISFTGSFVDPGILDTHAIQWDFGDGTTALETLAPIHTFEDDGVYTVTLTVTDDDGGIGTDTLTISINNVAPTADAGGPYSDLEGSSVSFSGSATDPGADTFIYEWDFNYDGVTFDVDSTLENPDNIYEDDGVYTVGFRVKDDDEGVSTIETTTVSIENVPPSVDAGPDQTVEEGSTVSFESTFTDPGTTDTHTIQWDFGDGTQTTGTLTTTHTYQDDGTYTITLTITDDDGGTGTDTLTVVVGNVPPTVSASNDGPKDEGLPVIVTADQVDPGADTFTYSFDWNDDGTYEIIDQENPSATYTWDDDGAYTVRVRVTDDDGGHGEATTDVVVLDLSPEAVFTWSPDLLDEGETMSFMDASISKIDAIISWQWEFGDGQTSTDQNPTHTYISDGIYTITLTITDDDGSEATNSSSVTVRDLDPTSNFTASQLTGPEPLAVEFDDTSTSYDGVTSYLWDFGDGETSTEKSPTHTYVQNGGYTVTLRVVEGDGDTSTEVKEAYIAVSDTSPIPDFQWMPSQPDEGSTMSFTDLSTFTVDPIVSWDWSFGDGGVSEEKNPGHTYKDDGVYGVTLTLIDGDGSVVIISHGVTVVNVAPTATATNTGPVEAGKAVLVSISQIDAGMDSFTYSFDWNDDGTYEIIDQEESFASYTWNASGSYVVRVRVTDDEGGHGEATTTVVVEEPPEKPSEEPFKYWELIAVIAVIAVSIIAIFLWPRRRR